MFIFPFLGEDGIGQGIVPATLLPFIFAEMPFPAHSNSLQQPDRGRILGETVRPDAMQSQLLEAKSEQGTNSFGCITVPPELAVKLIANIGFPHRGAITVRLNSPGKADTTGANKPIFG